MIYSKQIQAYTPVNVSICRKAYNDGICQNEFIRYTVKDKHFPVGYVDLQDTLNGVKVLFIKNMYPEKYSKFGKVADQIEVEHCIKRGLKDFDVVSQAGLNSHALHYLRGKRFVTDDFNKKIKDIIKKTPLGEKYNTSFLGAVDMYMPKNLINKYKKLISKRPILI